MKRSLSEVLRDADVRSRNSQIESEAKKEMYKIPWLSVAKHGLPKNDSNEPSDEPSDKRRQHLVTTSNGYTQVAFFGHHGHDWWITSTGQLLTPDFGCAVTHWAPLPPTPDSNQSSDSEPTSSSVSPASR